MAPPSHGRWRALEIVLMQSKGAGWISLWQWLLSACRRRPPFSRERPMCSDYRRSLDIVVMSDVYLHCLSNSLDGSWRRLMGMAHRRHDISDRVWLLLEPHLPGRAGSWGGAGQSSVHQCDLPGSSHRRSLA